MTWTSPPRFDKGKSYELYRKEVLAWGEVTDLPKTKQGIVIALSLPEDDDKRHIKESIFNQISIEILKTDGGLTVLLNFLDSLLGKDDLMESLEKYDDFEKFERKGGQSIKDYISMLDYKYKKIEKKNMKLTSEVLAFRLLRRANISRNEQLLILSGIDFDNRLTSYDQAKIALTKLRDCLETTSDGMSDIKLKPATTEHGHACSKEKGKSACQIKQGGNAWKRIVRGASKKE